MPPKHRSIFDTLKQQIDAGHYSHGKRLPSETELAKRFGVSRPTASRALRDLEHLGMIERRAGSGSYLRPAGCRPSQSRPKPPSACSFPAWATPRSSIRSATKSLASPKASAVLSSGGTPSSPFQLAKTFLRSAVSTLNAGGRRCILCSHRSHPRPRGRQPNRLLHVRPKPLMAIILLDRDVLEFPQPQPARPRRHR